LSNAIHSRAVKNAKRFLLVFFGGAILLLAAGNVYRRTIQKARESVMRRDLQATRAALYQYVLDGHQPPASLQTLVDEKYVGAIPTNPFTGKADWKLHYVRVDLGGGKSAVGIDDISASAPYNDW
jgi:general secretion pathway protein G